jgi:GNAT superfamily N-acetyltransferase
MEIQVRQMTDNDAPAVQKLSEQLGYVLSISEIKNNIRETISSKDHIAFVALHDRKIVGWIHAFKALFLGSISFIEIGGLVVDENCRSKGIGKKLIDRIKEWSLEKGINQVRVRSQVKRKEAHQFYLNNGFVEIKEQKVFQIMLW